jgi:hypothetical protein
MRFGRLPIPEVDAAGDRVAAPWLSVTGSASARLIISESRRWSLWSLEA